MNLPTRRQGRVPRIESFGPEFIEVWKRAPLQLEFREESAAIHFRFRLYSLRTALGNSILEEHRAIWLKAIKMKISKTRGFDTERKRTIYLLRIFDADGEHKSVLEQLGVTIPEPPDLDAE